MNIEITRDDLRAMNEIVQYLWDDERKDYRTEPRPAHVFLSVQALRNVIDRAGF